MTAIKGVPRRQLKNLLVLVGSTGGAQAIALAVTPVVARMYAPADFGVLGTFVAILSAALIIATLSYELAIPVEPDDVKAYSLASIGIVMSALFALLAAVLAIVFGSSICDGLNVPGLAKYLWLLPLSIFAAGSVKTLTYLAIRNKAYGSIGRSKISQALLQIAFQLGFGFLKVPGGLLMADAISRSGGALALWKSNSSTEGRKGLLDATAIREQLGKYKNYATISTPSAVLHSAGTIVPPLLIASIYGSIPAGFFALTQRVVWGPLSLIGQSIAQLFLGEVPKYAITDPKRLWRHTKWTVTRMFAIGFVPVVIVAMFGSELIVLVFGQKWEAAGQMAEILIVGYYVQLVVGPVLQLLNVLGRQYWLLGCDLLGIMLVLASFGVGKLWQLPVQKTLILYTAAVSIMYGALLLATIVAVRRNANMR